ncbi:MAG: class II aldolase/adducin family protein [Candidatus Heimdallarchaeaceae archaeon]
MPEVYTGVKFEYEKVGELEFDKNLNSIALEIQKALGELPKTCVEGVTGNISVRLHDGILITSTGTKLRNLTVPHSFCKVSSSFNDEIVSYYGTNVPSSETRMHQLIYENRPDIRYCLHIHVPNIEKLQLLNRHPITQKYYSYGTKELAKEAMKALGSNDVVILRDHGIVVVGNDLSDIIVKAQKLCNI